MSGAGFPCKQCGMSHRNTVHINKGQFGYHEHAPEEQDNMPEFEHTYTQAEVDAMLADQEERIRQLETERDILRNSVESYVRIARGNETQIVEQEERIRVLEAHIERIAELEGIDQACDAANEHVILLQARIDRVKGLADRLLADHQTTGRFAEMDMDAKDRAYVAVAKLILAALDGEPHDQPDIGYVGESRIPWESVEGGPKKGGVDV
jgi:hypothetical protein